MDEAAEDVVTLDGPNGKLDDAGLGNLEPQASVRPRPGVVLDVGAQHGLELAVREDE